MRKWSILPLMLFWYTVQNDWNGLLDNLMEKAIMVLLYCKTCLCCWSFIVTMHRATWYFSPLLARIPFCLIPFPVPFPFSAIFYFRINPACEQKDRPSTSPMRKTSWRRRTNKTHQKTYKTLKVYQDQKE